MSARLTTETTLLGELLREHVREGAPELREDLGEGKVRCVACAHRCRISDGKSGVCKVRFNAGGKLMVPWGYVAGIALDPIEKKPFFHAYPGRDALSFGMLGCDMHCAYCQNWVTSQALRDPEAVASIQRVTVDSIVEMAVRRGAPVLTSTYNEPLITSEWGCAVMKAGKERGLVGSYVSNGNATREVLEYIRPWVSLYKVDLKSFKDGSYRRLGTTLGAVLETLASLLEMGLWVEVVTLLVPGWNDSEEELRGLTRFLASLSPDIPWHVTAFHPDYEMRSTGRTSLKQLVRAAELGEEAGLRFVYAGNLPGQADRWENTWCPGCGKLLIERSGFRVLRNELTQTGGCAGCGRLIPGVWGAGAWNGATGGGRAGTAMAT